MSVCILLVCVYSTVYVHYLGKVGMLACIYIYPLLPLRDSPQAAAHVLYVVRSSIQSSVR